MTNFSMQLIPLSTAYLCQDCSVVGNCPHQCPACASSVLMGLANVLDRKQEKRARTRNRTTEFPAWHTQLQPVQLRHVA
jgi:CxxC motif-containing protein (DUF1111 family)